MTMNFEQALHSELSAVSGFTSKVFPSVAPEGTAAPYMTYETGGHTLDKAHSGFLTSGSLDCSIDILAATFSALKTSSDLVEAKIRSFLGRSIGALAAGPYIQNVIFREYNPTLYEPNVDLYRKTISFTVYF